MSNSIQNVRISDSGGMLALLFFIMWFTCSTKCAMEDQTKELHELRQDLKVLCGPHDAGAQ